MVENEVQVSGRDIAIEINAAALEDFVAGVGTARSVRVKRHDIGAAIQRTNRKLQASLFDPQRRTIGVLRTQVACFAMIDDSIATTRQRARVRTTVAVRRIAVVAFFARIDDAIAATRQEARARTTIAAVDVAIVALFDAGPDKPIAALRLDARDARVRRARIAVVALLAGIDDAVAARSQSASARTAITINHVAIVALFDSGPDKPIAALRFDARDARVRGTRVAVVALLARIDDAVAAAWRTGDALVRASVVVDGIAVVALLGAEPDEPIPAPRLEAIDAGIVGIDIRVVTLLAAIEDAVATTGQSQDAAIRTSIVVDGISVIALLDAKPNECVTASSLRAVDALVIGIGIRVVALLARIDDAVAARR